MSRSRKSKRTAGQVSTGGAMARERAASEGPAADRTGLVGAPDRVANRSNLAYSTMVALGFWGLAIFCTFFYVADPNHYLYGAIMGLTAVGWTAIMVRRWVAYRQRV